ncbi:MAG: SDR family oxidoreductase [Alphaproteobacteria bacterium]|nr:SDR family oxidoreductase [Alphaproteobacteria bacterium]
MGQLQDKVAIVTGASGGIGRAIAIAFAQEGAKVVLAARRAELLKEVADEIAADGRGAALAIPTDVTDEDQVAELFSQTAERFGQIDILVNNAGGMANGPTKDLALEDWQRVVDLNLTGAFLCSRQAFRHMIPQARGRILNIGSVSASVSRPQSAAYTSTKFALEGLTRSMALDGREHGIAVSILHPGNAATDIWKGREEIAKKEGTIPLDTLAGIAVAQVALPDGINLLTGTILPVTMPYIGRG